MAKQRPSLSVSAAPVSTYVGPGNIPLAGVELYDQQTVNLALQFSNAFRDLSVTAASFAANLKINQNKEDLQAGRDMVNQSQKSYQQLVQTGQISPAENPWMAVGAQEASGAMAGMRARAQFQSLYEQKATEDPKFFAGSDSFNALASSFAEQANATMGDAAYMSRAFYESFNPFIASMAMKHEENVVQDRKNKILMGVGAEVARAVQDLQSIDPLIRETSLSVLQEKMDAMGRMGVGFQEVNRAVVDNLVAVMATSEQTREAEEIFNNLQTGTGLLKDSEYAKMAMMQNAGKIEANKSKLTVAESRMFFEDWSNIKAQALAGKMTDEQVLEWYDSYVEGPNAKITVSGPDSESRRNWVLSDLARSRDNQARLKAEADYEVFLTTANARAATPSPEELADPTAHFMRMEDEFETMMGRMGWPEERKMQGRKQIRAIFEAAAERRVMLANYQATKELWEGSLTVQGLNFQISNQFRDFVTAPINPQDPVDSALAAPNFDDMKARIDNYRQAVGILPGSEQAVAADRADFARINSMIDAYEQAQDLLPKDTDSPDVKSQKASIRARTKFLRMNLGRTFGNKSEMTNMVNRFVSLLNPGDMQAGTVAWPAEDYLRALAMYNNRNLPLEDLIPSGPYGKALGEELQWALSRTQSGEDLSNILADWATMKIFGRSMQFNPFQMQINPLGWADWVEKGDDQVDFIVKTAEFKEASGITNPDAAAHLFMVSVFKDEYLVSLGKNKDHATAMEEAAAAVREKNIVVRGSMIPKTSLGREAADSPELVAAWTDTMFPGQEATLVVVQKNFDGSVMLAPRDSQGRIIPGGRLINSREIKRTPEMLPKFKELQRETSRRKRSSDRFIFPR